MDSGPGASGLQAKLEFPRVYRVKRIEFQRVLWGLTAALGMCVSHGCEKLTWGTMDKQGTDSGIVRTEMLTATGETRYLKP